MQYYQVPEEVLEDPGELAVWAGKAVEVATRAKARRSRRTDT
jgi:TfoX/Sxy family transcriptional regulator of competence genes